MKKKNTTKQTVKNKAIKAARAAYQVAHDDLGVELEALKALNPADVAHEAACSVYDALAREALDPATSAYEVAGAIYDALGAELEELESARAACASAYKTFASACDALEAACEKGRNK